MTQKSQTLKFKDAWGFPQTVEARIASFIDRHPGLWLHAPVGKSKLGLGQFKNPDTTIITLDRDETLNPDIVCNVFEMAQHIKIMDIIKKYGGFDGVISDPLWYFSEQCPHCKEKITNLTKGLAYDERRYLSFAVRQVLKPGGIWIFNGLWFPKVKGLSEYHGANPKGTSIEIPVQAYQSFRNFSALVYMQRTSESIEDI